LRKRSKYRPKGVILNTLAYVMEGMVSVAQHDTYLVDLKIKNHLAMSNLTQGRAVQGDIDILISMCNMTEALYRLGFGKEYADVVGSGLVALRTLAKRGAQSGGRFILKADEMTAMNLVIELHDAQMDVITIKDMERAIALVNEEWRNKRMTPILEKEKNHG
jgi:hypothetical protein